MVLTLMACGSQAQDDPEQLRHDALLIQEAIGSDRSTALMVDVERSVSARKPVHAATMIEKAVMPELDAQIERVRDLQLATVGARKLRLRVVAAYERRKEGVVMYRRELATGTVESVPVIEALRVQRDAEAQLMALDAELWQIRPVGAAPK